MHIGLATLGADTVSESDTRAPRCAIVTVIPRGAAAS